MIYRAKVEDLQTCLSGSDIHSTEAAAILRQLIDKVVLTPDAEAPDGLRAELHGDLAMILALSPPAAPVHRIAQQGLGGASGTSIAVSQLSVVGGTRNSPMSNADAMAALRRAAPV